MQLRIGNAERGVKSDQDVIGNAQGLSVAALGKATKCD